ncbi:MAG: hypothetical protein ACFFCI_00375 [Promethearchaeota archaeon]
MSIVSTFLAEMSTHDLQSTDHIDHIDHVDQFDHLDHVDHVDQFDHLDHVDHVDHVDQFDHLDHVDHVDHVDQFDHADYADHMDHIDHADQLDHVDHVDQFDHANYADHMDHIDHTDQIDHVNDTTPAPFMLLFSTSLLFFGILGILFYYLFNVELRFLLVFTTVVLTYFITKLISIGWRRIAKSRYYKISSTENLIGTKGEVILDVDNQGGVIKIFSNTPMKFEKVHVKPLNPNSQFKKGENVYICDVREGFLLVDTSTKSIRNLRGRI